MRNNFLADESTIISFWRFLQNKQTKLEKIGQLFQFAIHPQPKMIDSSCCALVGLPLTKLDCCFNVPINTNKLFLLFKVTLKMGDTAPLRRTPGKNFCDKQWR